MTREALQLLRARVEADVLEGQVFVEELGGSTSRSSRELIGMLNLASILLQLLAESTGDSKEFWMEDLAGRVDRIEDRSS